MPTASELRTLADVCVEARGIELECSALGEAVKRVLPADATVGAPMGLIYIARTARNIDFAMGAAVAMADALDADGSMKLSSPILCWWPGFGTGGAGFDHTGLTTAPTRTMALAAAALYAAADRAEGDDG